MNHRPTRASKICLSPNATANHRPIKYRGYAPAGKRDEHSSAYLPIKLIVLVNHPVNSVVRRAREGRKQALYNNSKNNNDSSGVCAACELLACKWIAGKAGARSSVYISLLCPRSCALCTATRNVYDPPWPRAYFMRATHWPRGGSTALELTPASFSTNRVQSSRDIDGTVFRLQVRSDE